MKIDGKCQCVSIVQSVPGRKSTTVDDKVCASRMKKELIKIFALDKMPKSSFEKDFYSMTQRSRKLLTRFILQLKLETAKSKGG